MKRAKVEGVSNNPADVNTTNKPEIPNATKDAIPTPTGNRQIDNAALAAQARQTFPTPKDMTYQTPKGGLVGKEHTAGDGTPILQTENGQRYRGTLNEKGNIEKWQPINEKGQEIGKPINVTSERTGSPPAGVSPEKYLSAPKPSENQKTPEPAKSEQKVRESDTPKNEPPKAEAKSIKELYESNKQTFDPQKQYLERAVQSLSAPVSAEKTDSKTTKVEHISITPTRPEMERTSVPQNIFAQRIERTITAQPNTVEYGREFVNNRDSRQLFKPALESVFQKPDGLQLKPEPFSQLRPDSLRSPDSKTGFVSPLQGFAEPFTFTPKNPINRTDIIEQLGEIGKGKNPFSIVSLLPAILAIGRRPEAREPNQKLEPSKALDSVINGRLEPALKANLDKVQQPQKDKFVEIATKIKENKADNLAASDDRIAKRIQQLEPKQIDLLIAWGQGKSPIKFEGLRQDFQTKLSSIFETIIKATQLVSTDKTSFADLRSQTAKPNVQSMNISEKIGADKTVLGDKMTFTDKSKSVESSVAISKDQPPYEGKTRPISRTDLIQEERPIAAKGSDPTVEPDKTVVKSELAIEDESDGDTKPSKDSDKGTLIFSDGTMKRRNRKTKPMQEQIEIVNPIQERNKLPGSKTTLLSNSARRHEVGSLDSLKYSVTLETLFEGIWHKVLECVVHDDDVLFLTHKLHGVASKQSIGVASKVAELIQNNFFLNWQDRIDEFLGVSK